MKKFNVSLLNIAFLLLMLPDFIQAQSQAGINIVGQNNNFIHSCSFKNIPIGAAIDLTKDTTEDVSKRTIYSSTWITKDGKEIIKYSSVPINYSDANNNLQPIDGHLHNISNVIGPTSYWTGGSTPSCIYPDYYTDSILITVPAGISITFFTVDYAYVTSIFGNIPLTDGLFYLSTPCGETDTLGCAGDTAGVCYLVPNTDLHSLLTSCITPSCNPQSFWLDAHLSRFHGGVGCDTTVVWYSAYYDTLPQYHFSAYLEGTPIISITPILTANTNHCNGTAKVLPSGGTAPYTYLWTPGNQTTDSIGGLCDSSYCCFVTDSKGCTDSICVTISNTSAINYINNSSAINIYPDPNNGNFTVSGLIPGQYAELYDLLGRKLNTFISNDVNLQLNISDEYDGVYLIEIFNKDGSLVGEKKIVKMK